MLDALLAKDCPEKNKKDEKDKDKETGMYVGVTITIDDDEETTKEGIELIKKTNDNEFKNKIENNEFCGVSDDVKTEEW